jgi:hypothetical protein
MAPHSYSVDLQRMHHQKHRASHCMIALHPSSGGRDRKDERRGSPRREEQHSSSTRARDDPPPSSTLGIYGLSLTTTEQSVSADSVLAVVCRAVLA